jgi:hypothetical protein
MKWDKGSEERRRRSEDENRKKRRTGQAGGGQDGEERSGKRAESGVFARTVERAYRAKRACRATRAKSLARGERERVKRGQGVPYPWLAKKPHCSHCSCPCEYEGTTVKRRAIK